MIVTHKINMDLTRRGSMPCVDVTQGDKYSRELEICLRMNGEPFVLPEGCSVLIHYSKTMEQKKVSGAYDTMPDGSPAWRIDGDKVTVGLAPQLCAAAGKTEVTVTLLRGGAELGCFAVCLEVHGKSGSKERREPYVNVNGFLPQPGGAHVGQYLEVQAVDDFGRIVKLKTVDPEKADWSAPEGEPGHVKNRTHWAEPVEIDPNWDGDMTGRVVLPMGTGLSLVKISDYVPTEAECVGAELTLVTQAEEETQAVPAEWVVDVSAQYGISCFMVGYELPFVVVVREAGTAQGLEVSAGTYYLHLVEDGVTFYISCFSALEHGEVVHKLDRKFLPDDIGGGGVFTVTVTDNGNGNYTADKTIAEMDAAYRSGMVLRCVAPSGDTMQLDLAVAGQGYSFSGFVSGNTAAVNRAVIAGVGNNFFTTTLLSKSDLPTALPNPFPLCFRNALAGSYAAIARATYGSHETNGSKRMYIFGIANPYALTINGKTYDGSAELDLTDTINAMIDAKLAEIASAEEVAF